MNALQQNRPLGYVTRILALFLLFCAGVLGLVASGGGGGTTVPVTFTLTATATSASEMGLTWTPSPDAPAKYDIFRDGTLVASAAKTATSFVDTNLSPSTKYCYVVYARAVVGTLGSSNESCDTTTTMASWVRNTVGNISSTGGYSSLALDSNNTAYIAYRGTDKAGVSGVYFSTSAAGSSVWSTPVRIGSPIALTSNYGAISLFSYSPTNQYVSYYDGGANSLLYASYAASAWGSTSAIDPAGGFANSLVIDASSGYPYIAESHNSSSNSSNSSLAYLTTPSGGAFTLTPIPINTNQTIRSVSLGLDSNTALHIAYAVSTGTIGVCDIHYIGNASNSWVDETVAVGADCGVSLAMDTSGQPHIAYMSGATLWFASRDAPASSIPATWSPTPVINLPGNGGSDVSLAADSSGHMHISYQDGQQHLRYATNASGQWTSLIIDAAGDVGAHSSIKVDSTGKVHISYDDTSAHQLIYTESP